MFEVYHVVLLIVSQEFRLGRRALEFVVVFRFGGWVVGVHTSFGFSVASCF